MTSQLGVVAGQLFLRWTFLRLSKLYDTIPGGRG